MGAKTLQVKNNLDKNLNYLVNKSLTTLTGETYYERLEIFNFTTKKIKDINCNRIYNELNYRLEEGENFNTLLLELLEKYEELETKIYTIKAHLEQFEYEDEFKRYFP